ncbi:hypothetical protein PULV_a2961 [Pseudoalteromonas ulvae UL12]|nr:hypothetical protein [Pseudoalteromonas ulvae UL12]
MIFRSKILFETNTTTEDQQHHVIQNQLLQNFHQLEIDI